MYLTGDYAKLLPDGNMVYLGRMDNQVKIKGVRIELEEIEAVLLEHPHIREAAVIVRDNHEGVKYLAAYIVTGEKLTLRELRTYLLEKVPEYMVPTAFFKVDQMPLTASGKLDGKYLPERGIPIKADSQYTAPRNDREHQLAQDWAEILKLEKIGIDDNFFEMGGDSLRGNLLLARINNRFNTGISGKDLFDAPTIREFSKILSLSKTKNYTPITPVEKKEYYPAASAQKRLFIIHQLNKDDTGYNFPMGMIIQGHLDKDRLKQAIKQLVRRHESMRTGFTVRDGEIVQKIEENPGVEMELFEEEGWDDTYIEKIINGDIQPRKIPGEVEDNLLASVKLTKVKRQTKKDLSKGIETYRASSAQKRLYLIDRLYGNSILYNMPFGWMIEGQLEPPRLKTAIKKLTRRHETLRTSFAAKEGEVLQNVHENLEFQLKCREIEENSSKDIDAIIDEFVQPFELAHAPLWRMELVRLEPGKQLLLFDIHHIICDGVSMGVVIDDLMTFYTDGEPPELEYQYLDFTWWQNKQWESERIKRQEQYWLKVFEGELPVWEMPVDYPRSSTPDINGNTIEFEMDRDLTSKIEQLASKRNTTLYVVLLTLYTILLSKTTGQEDIVVGTTVTGRSHREFESIIGMFVNTLALRNQPAGVKNFSAFLQEVSQNVFSAFENQDYPFETLVEKLLPRRRLNRNPLFETMFSLQNYSQNLEIFDPGQGKLKFSPYLYKEKIAKFDVMLLAFEKEGGILFELQYRSSLFRQDTMERFIRHFIKLTQTVVMNPGPEISRLEIITEKEIKYLLDVLNATDREYPKDKTIHQLFEKQVEKTPDNIAVVGDHEGTRGLAPLYITYRQLNQKANQLAYLLIEKGVQPDTIVGIMLKRSIGMMVGILAILKAGGAYLPIDPDYPEERKQYMLADSAAKILLTRQEKAGLYSPQVLYLSEGHHPSFPASQLPNFPASLSSSLAYIIYTSGTTGKPKGTMVRHINVVRLVKNTNYVEFKENDRILQTGALEFDASTFEIWGSLLNGLQLALVKNEVILSPGKLKETLEKNRITTIWLTAPLFNQLLDEEIEIFRGLKNLLVGGDVLSPPHINRLRNQYPHLNIINGYGPTENTTFSTTFLIDRQYRESIPIGNPIANSTAYIVDKYGNLQPIGIVGELWVGGDGVARGYLNNPELTAAKFIFAPNKIYRSNMSYKSYILYRTGDLTRWLPEGNIEFLGRKDHQVKIRGFRIELEEIENQLLKHPGINKAVVITKGKNDIQDNYLCAYIVPGEPIVGEKEKIAALAAQLKEYLSHSLPDYMIPAYFTAMENIPLTPSGKIDRKALPEPETGQKKENYTAPRDEIQGKLVQIWAEVLGSDPRHASQLRESISIDDNFFNLGGHSLKAALMATKIHRALNINITMAQVFKTPTVRSLAGHIKGMAPGKYEAVKAVEKKEYYELSSAQKRLYVIRQMDLESIAYNMPLFLWLTGKLHKKKFEATFRQLIKRHESLRTSFEIVNEKPVQRVHDEVEFKIEYFKVKVEVEEERPSCFEGTGGLAPLLTAPAARGPRPAAALISSFIRPFALSPAPLMRAAWLKMEEEKHLLMIDMHHIISDEVSHDIFLDHLAALYRGNRLPPLRLQYKDFSQWHNNLIESGTIKKQEEYWVKSFKQEIPLLKIPTDYERPDVLHFQGSAFTFEIGAAPYAEIKSLVSESKITLNIFLLAAYNVLLSKYTGQQTILVGNVIAGRKHADLQNIIGFFVNMLAIKNHLVPQQTFEEFLGVVKENSIAAYENQDYQFEELVSKLDIERKPGRHPLIDAVFVMQELGDKWNDIPSMEDAGLQVSPYEIQHKATHFDLMLHAAAKNDSLDMNIEYSNALFKPGTIEAFSKCYIDLLEQVVKNKKIKLRDIVISDDYMKESPDKLQDRDLEFEF